MIDVNLFDLSLIQLFLVAFSIGAAVGIIMFMVERAF